MVNDIVIPRDTKLPCSITKNYKVLHDNQKEIDCLHKEGEETDKEFVHIISNKPLKLSNKAKEGDLIKVTYSYDLNGKMHCIFEEVNQEKQELNLKPGTSKDLKELRENLDFDIE